MNKWVVIPVVSFFLLAVALTSPVSAAELLDVKPVVTGTGLVIEVTADIPMTYTYYKVPGQARAVVDIADADPDKVEPLIVVNKGAVSSISVDKAMIGDMTVSRIVFNLVAETDIFVKQGPDLKTLNVTFGGGKAIAAKPASAPVIPAVDPAPVPAAAPLSISETKGKEPVAKDEDDPLGLDEPQPAKTAAVIDFSPAARSAKLAHEIESPSATTAVAVKGIVVGASFIEIQTTGPVEKFKQLQLSKPERLLIEIPGTSIMKTSSVQIKRFGVTAVRIGTVSGLVRVVLDAARTPFPKYEIVTKEDGIQIKFK